MAMATLSGHAVALPPEQEYSLQARVLLQDDADARHALRVLGEGAAPASSIDWQPVVDDVPAWLARQSFPSPSPAIVRAFAEALALRLPQVRCTAQDFVALGSPEIGMYRLLCRHPDVEPLRQGYLALRDIPTRKQQAHVDMLFSRWAALLREAPDAPHCTPVTGWYRARHEFAHAERAHQLHQAILGRLLPFDRWLRQPIVADAEAVCDLAEDALLPFFEWNEHLPN